MATVLIAEDDKSTQLLTKARLSPHYTVLCADDGQQALDIVYSQAVDMIVADVMMPLMDGFTLLKTLRDAGNAIPVLLLTAKQGFEDKREGFSAGTDDYLTKPVNYDELLWHISALLRRAGISAERKISLPDFEINAQTFEIQLHGQPLTPPRKEFELLYKLLSYPGRIFTKAQLLEDIWGFESESTEDTVKTHMSRLRTRLVGCTAFEIITVKGIGYKAVLRG